MSIHDEPKQGEDQHDPEGLSEPVAETAERPSAEQLATTGREKRIRKELAVIGLIAFQGVARV